MFLKTMVGECSRDGRLVAVESRSAARDQAIAGSYIG